MDFKDFGNESIMELAQMSLKMPKDATFSGNKMAYFFMEKAIRGIWLKEGMGDSDLVSAWAYHDMKAFKEDVEMMENQLFDSPHSHYRRKDASIPIVDQQFVPSYYRDHLIQVDDTPMKPSDGVAIVPPRNSLEQTPSKGLKPVTPSISTRKKEINVEEEMIQVTTTVPHMSLRSGTSYPPPPIKSKKKVEEENEAENDPHEKATDQSRPSSPENRIPIRPIPKKIDAQYIHEYVINKLAKTPRLTREDLDEIESLKSLMFLDQKSDQSQYPVNQRNNNLINSPGQDSITSSVLDLQMAKVKMGEMKKAANARVMAAFGRFFVGPIRIIANRGFLINDPKEIINEVVAECRSDADSIKAILHTFMSTMIFPADQNIRYFVKIYEIIVDVYERIDYVKMTDVAKACSLENVFRRSRVNKYREVFHFGKMQGWTFIKMINYIINDQNTEMENKLVWAEMKRTADQINGGKNKDKDKDKKKDSKGFQPANYNMNVGNKQGEQPNRQANNRGGNGGRGNGGRSNGRGGKGGRSNGGRFQGNKKSGEVDHTHHICFICKKTGHISWECPDNPANYSLAVITTPSSGPLPSQAPNPPRQPNQKYTGGRQYHEQMKQKVTVQSPVITSVMMSQGADDDQDDEGDAYWSGYDQSFMLTIEFEETAQDEEPRVVVLEGEDEIEAVEEEITEGLQKTFLIGDVKVEDDSGWFDRVEFVKNMKESDKIRRWGPNYEDYFKKVRLTKHSDEDWFDELFLHADGVNKEEIPIKEDMPEEKVNDEEQPFIPYDNNYPNVFNGISKNKARYFVNENDDSVIVKYPAYEVIKRVLDQDEDDYLYQEPIWPIAIEFMMNPGIFGISKEEEREIARAFADHAYRMRKGGKGKEKELKKREESDDEGSIVDNYMVKVDKVNGDDEADEYFEEEDEEEIEGDYGISGAAASDKVSVSDSVSSYDDFEDMDTIHFPNKRDPYEFDNEICEAIQAFLRIYKEVDLAKEISDIVEEYVLSALGHRRSFRSLTEFDLNDGKAQKRINRLEEMPLNVPIILAGLKADKKVRKMIYGSKMPHEIKSRVDMVCGKMYRTLMKKWYQEFEASSKREKKEMKRRFNKALKGAVRLPFTQPDDDSSDYEDGIPVKGPKVTSSNASPVGNPTVSEKPTRPSAPSPPVASQAPGPFPASLHLPKAARISYSKAKDAQRSFWSIQEERIKREATWRKNWEADKRDVEEESDDNYEDDDAEVSEGEGAEVKDTRKIKIKEEKKDDNNDGRKYEKNFFCILAFASEASNQNEDITTDPNAIIMDTGASRHIFKNDEFLHHVRGAKNIIRDGNGGITNTFLVGEAGILKRVIISPSSPKNIVSVGELTKKGYQVKMNQTWMDVFDPDNNLISRAMRAKDNLYYLTDTNLMKGEGIFCLLTQEQIIKGAQPNRFQKSYAGLNPLDVLHRRFNHWSEQKLKDIVKLGEVAGLNVTYDQIKNLTLSPCDACYRAKATRFPTYLSQSEVEKQPFEVIAADIVGKIQVRSIHGNSYFILYVDYATNYVFTYFVKNKDELIDTLKKLYDEYIKSSDFTFKVLQSDSEQVFKDKTINKWCDELGIRQQYSPPHHHQANGKCERTIRTIIEAARTMMLDSASPANLWEHAVHHAAYLFNRTPLKRLGGKAPLFKAFKRRPDLSGIPPFGSPGYMYRYKEEKDGRPFKFGEIAVPINFLGISDKYKNGFIVKTKSGAIFIRRDVIFTEKMLQDVLPEINAKRDELDVLNIDLNQPHSDLIDDDGKESSSHEPMVKEEEVENNDPINADSDQKKEIQEPRRSDRVKKKNVRFGDYVMNVVDEQMLKSRTPTINFIRTPMNVKEALDSSNPYKEYWKKAICEEVDEMYSREALVDVDPQEVRDMGRKPFKSKFVFKVKHEPDGSTKFKARLVGCGYSQVKGVDYDETYSPTANFYVAILIIFLAATFGWKLIAMDIGNAYLEARADKLMFMQLPLDYTNGEIFTVRLDGNINGTKQGGLLWYQRIEQVLFDFGFIRSEVEACLFHYYSNDKLLHLLLYVDDILLAGNDEILMENFINHLLTNFKKVSIQREVKKFLGVHISTATIDGFDYLLLSQKEYIEENMKKYVNDNVTTPLPLNLDKIKEDEDEKTRQPTQDACGIARFLVDRTRVDCMFAASFNARYSANPTQVQRKASERTMNYLYNTRDYKLKLGSSTGNIYLKVYTDAAFSAEKDSKSQLCYLFFLADDCGSVYWKSMKDKCVSTSSTHAEINGLYEATKSIIWYRLLLKEFKQEQFLPTLVRHDNNNAVTLVNDNAIDKGTKYLISKINFIREAIHNGIIQVVHVDTESNIADMGTKSLDEKTLFRFANASLNGPELMKDV